MVTVIDDNKDFVAQLNKKVAKSKLNVPSDIVLVNASYKSGSLRDYYMNIDEAEKCVESGKRVILYSFMPMSIVYLEHHFARLFANHPSNVRYLRLPFEINEVVKIFNVPQYENPALKFLTSNTDEENFIYAATQGTVDRKAYGWKIDTSYLEDARNHFGWKGSDDEIMDMLEKKRQEIEENKGSRAIGLFFPGVFCDVEGTFLTYDKVNRVNEDLAKELEKYALEKPVNLWTGGKIESMAHKVGDVRYPVLFKGDYRGAEVELAIDNLTQEEFEKEYEIKAREFKKV